MFQHVSFEGLGSIGRWAEACGHRIGATRFFQDEPIPSLDDFHWLVVMGGPMNIYEDDRYPWLPQERQSIRQAIAAGKVVIGICLGAQPIADALGSRVYRNTHKEIGWFHLQKAPEAADSGWGDSLPFDREVFHWHGDTFDLPKGAVRLAQTEACNNQAFVYGDRVMALQFHLEMTREAAGELVRHCGDEIVEAPFIQPGERILGDGCRFEKINESMDRLLDQIAAQVSDA